MAEVSLSLAGKAALITGGSRGIGAETVRLFRAAGARVAFSYRAAADRARALEDEQKGEPGDEPLCVGIAQALETAADGRALVEKAVAALGRLDILVVNHGIWPPEDASIATMTDAQWRRTMGVNLDAVFGAVQAAVTQMRGQRDNGTREKDEAAGHIVLISSTAGQRGEAFHSDYAASKGALISLTKSLSSELAPIGISVNCVAPGWVDTEMAAGTLGDPVLGPRVRAQIPLGRPASPGEIAGPVLFLCTPLAGFISGEVLNVNGGAVLVG
jgi:3-oxoacyl-[acyl-carrier protein] reductase